MGCRTRATIAIAAAAVFIGSACGGKKEAAPAEDTNEETAATAGGSSVAQDDVIAPAPDAQPPPTPPDPVPRDTDSSGTKGTLKERAFRGEFDQTIGRAISGLGAATDGGRGGGLSTGRGIGAEAKVSVKAEASSGELGGLTRAQISEGVLARRNAIRTCYARQLERSKGLSGRVVVSWTITDSGTVKGAKIASSSLKHRATEDCILRQFSRMRFPSPGPGATPVVTFPLVFSAP